MIESPRKSVPYYYIRGEKEKKKAREGKGKKKQERK